MVFHDIAWYWIVFHGIAYLIDSAWWWFLLMLWPLAVTPHNLHTYSHFNIRIFTNIRISKIFAKIRIRWWPDEQIFIFAFVRIFEYSVFEWELYYSPPCPHCTIGGPPATYHRLEKESHHKTSFSADQLTTDQWICQTWPLGVSQPDALGELGQTGLSYSEMWRHGTVSGTRPPPYCV